MHATAQHRPWLWGSANETLPFSCPFALQSGPLPTRLKTPNLTLALQRLPPPQTLLALLFLSSPDSVLRASARLAGRFTTALASMSHTRKGQPLPGPQPLASSGASLAIPFQTHNSTLPPSESQPSGPVGKDLELMLCESKCVSLTPKPLLSPLVFPASGDTANAVTQTQGKEAKKTHAPDVTSRVRTVLLCAAGQDHRHADLPEPGPGQPLQPLFQARSPGVQNHVDSTHFFHCPVPPLGTPSPSQNQALRMLPGDPTPRQNISPWYPSPEHSAWHREGTR